MTIQNRELNRRLSNLQRCAETAPDGTYEHAKSAARVVDRAIEAVRSALQISGFKVDGCDKCRDLEAAIYGYLLASNPDDSELVVSEGFGEHVDGPRGSEIIAAARRGQVCVAGFDERMQPF